MIKYKNYFSKIWTRWRRRLRRGDQQADLLQRVRGRRRGRRGCHRWGLMTSLVFGNYFYEPSFILLVILIITTYHVSSLDIGIELGMEEPICTDIYLIQIWLSKPKFSGRSILPNFLFSGFPNFTVKLESL